VKNCLVINNYLRNRLKKGFINMTILKQLKEDGIISVDNTWKDSWQNRFIKSQYYLIKIIERSAGKDHFRCFKDYIKQGGLDELLKRNKLETKIIVINKNINHLKNLWNKNSNTRNGPDVKITFHSLKVAFHP